MGSGYTGNTRGVAILLNKKWNKSVQNFVPIDERMAYLDLHIPKFMNIRFIVAYFPHSGYTDKEVQKLYDVIDALQQDAHKVGMKVIVAADFNAQVGPASEDDDMSIVGRYALGPENSRGQWLSNWATLRQLALANTIFTKRIDYITTYISPSKRTKQLDYILLDKCMRPYLQDAYSTNMLDLGSDHKA
eukprot:3744968-Karenia_brevis.AAC.1